MCGVVVAHKILVTSPEAKFLFPFLGIGLWTGTWPRACQLNCQGNWHRANDLLPHPNPGDDGDQPESVPGHGVPPHQAQPADQGCQGVEEVKVRKSPKHVIQLFCLLEGQEC